jgi:NADH:ubiquinone oxidoreductase subunit F (NADH-binding)/(2Fe-2S) ferredoxin/Pyruvate/2-oxoacid:ferredoxin oxidoreductase delta subunit
MQLPIVTSEHLEKACREAERLKAPAEHVIYLCAGTGCRASGALALAEAMRAEIADKGLAGRVALKLTGCHGFCEKGPLIVHHPSGVFYQRLKPKDVREVLETTLEGGSVVERLLYRTPGTDEIVRLEKDIPFYKHQKRLVFDLNGRIDPFDIDDYLAHGGYRALARALAMEPEKVLEEVERANLRGRGGGGFPAGRKWRSCRDAPAPEGIRYVICNADEGDPGAFMDRSVIEGNPHRVIEGMVIGAWAIGGTDGYVYIRHEYPLAVETLARAIEDARRYGFLGADILGSGLGFDIRINRGGGAFVCGESTALMASIEGEVGEPRAKHIHTVVQGLYNRPTNLNNVESWANVPLIVMNGSKWFRSIGTEGSSGTKIFSLVGKVANTGLVEVPMGLTLRSLIYDIGGGILGGKEFKAVQTGGPSGGAIPAKLLDLPVDFDSLTKAGSMMGSGGAIVMDEATCMVDVARYFTKFLEDESCGKCVTCREGLRQMGWILDDVCAGRGKAEHVELLRDLGEVVAEASLCALGGTAANPLVSTLNYFEEEYREHIEEHVCRALVCKDLIRYEIVDEMCTACGICRKECPTEAITGAKKTLHVLDQDKCIRCGVCFDACKYGSVRVVSGGYSRTSEQTKFKLRPVLGEEKK